MKSGQNILEVRIMMLEFFLQDNSANSIVLSLFKSDAKRLARTFSGSLRFSLLDDDSSGWKQHKYNVEKIK